MYWESMYSTYKKRILYCTVRTHTTYQGIRCFDNKTKQSKQRCHPPRRFCPLLSSQDTREVIRCARDFFENQPNKNIATIADHGGFFIFDNSQQS